MVCRECGGAVVTKVVTEIQPNQSRLWFWALQCSQCDHLVDVGLRSDSHYCVSSWYRPVRKPHFER